MLSPRQTDTNSLSNYFKSIFHIYKSSNGYISRFALASITNLPLILSDRIFYSILEARKNSCSIHKSTVIENLIKFYSGKNHFQHLKIMSFLDKEDSGIIIKTDIRLLILYFQTFLKQPSIEEVKISKIIDSVFREKEAIHYRTDYEAFLSEEQNSNMINLFYYFLLKITPLDEYPQYLDIENCKGQSYSPQMQMREKGKERKTIHPLSYQSKSYFSNQLNKDEFDNGSGDDCELVLLESDNDSMHENDELIEYDLQNVNKNDDESCSFDSSNTSFSRGKKKKLSFEQRKMSTSLFLLDEDNDNGNENGRDLSSHKSVSSNSFHKIKEHLLLYQEDDGGLKQYKFIVDANYIYYSQLKKKKVAIPIEFSYTNDIKQTMIKAKKHYQLTLICLYLFHNFKIDLYSKNKEDLEAFASEVKQYSQYKPINDSYEFVEEIGSGNFSIVYLGRNKSSKNRVAIKAIEKRSVYDSKQFEMLQNEYDIFHFLCKSTHKNIAKGIEFLSSLDRLYFVYEYLPQRFVDIENSKIDSNKFLHYMGEILNGLAFLHSNGIIHRDIKPDNIMLDDNNTIKLIDLGLGAIITSSDSIMNHSCGTLLFTAPEIIMGKPYGTKCDIWSLGIIAHDYLYGYNPFEGRSIEEIAKKITSGFVDLNSNLSKTIIGDLIKRCLVVDQDSRINLSEIKQMLSSA